MPRKRQKNKRYSPELKIAVVEAYLSGKGSMAELAKEYGLSDESRVRDWLKCYNGHRKFKRQSAARGALYMTKGKKTTQQERAEIVAFCLGCILPTPNAPGQRVFSRCTAPFFLEIVSIPAKKCLAQCKNSSLQVTLGVGRIHPRTRQGLSAGRRALWSILPTNLRLGP